MSKEITIKISCSKAFLVAVNMKNNVVVAHYNNMATVVIEKARKTDLANPTVMFVPKLGDQAMPEYEYTFVKFEIPDANAII